MTTATSSLKSRIIKSLWTTRRSLDGLRRSLGLPHDDLMTLVAALAELLAEGKVRFWGETNTRPGVETMYVAS